MAFNRRTITKELDMANLAKHNDNYADIKTELDAHDASISTHVAAQTAHGSTPEATAGKIMQRDSNGRAKVAAPVATDDIARKAEVDAVQMNLDDHEADAAVHLSAADRTKLDGIEAGAEPNQNAFAQVNDVVAAAETDTLTIEGGTGITISTNPTTKKVIVTATGEATPGPHGTSHNIDGADPIPDLAALRSDFDALTPADIGAETPEGAQAKVDALAGAGNTKTVRQVADEITGVTAQLADLAEDKVSKGELVINVKDFGAVADGVTNDSPAIQTAINHAHSVGGGIVYLPSGNYFIGVTLIIKNGVSLTGAGSANWDFRGYVGTWLFMDPVLSHLIEVGNDTTGFVNGCGLHDICLSVKGYENGGSVTGVGLWERNAYYFISENVYIEGFSTGVKIGDSTLNKGLNHYYTNTDISDCDTAININHGADITFNGGRIGTNGNGAPRKQGILIEGDCDSVVFNRLIIAHNPGYQYNARITNVTSVFWITFNDCDFETATVASLHCDSIASQVRINNSWVGSPSPMVFSAGSRIVVRDCTFGNHESLPSAVHITGSASNVTIEQNDFTSSPAVQVKIDTSGSGIMVRNNMIQGGGVAVRLSPTTGNPSRWSIIENNLIDQVDNAISIDFAVLTNVQIKNNFISGYTNHGILLAGSTSDVSVDVQGNRIETTATSGVRRSILINSAMSGVVVANNNLRGNVLTMVDNSVAPKSVTNNLT
jgi:hypothetical protein